MGLIDKSTSTIRVCRPCLLRELAIAMEVANLQQTLQAAVSGELPTSRLEQQLNE